MADIQAVIFDVDGVLVDSPHEQAWRDTLEQLMTTEWRALEPQSRYSPERFTTAFYQEKLAGKAREDGARAALEAFGVPDPARHAPVYAARKQERLLQLIQEEKFQPFPDALRFLLSVKARRLPVAAASSSKNANLLLAMIEMDDFVRRQGMRYPFVQPRTTLLELFDHNVCGRSFPSKPSPDIFLAAARGLDVPEGRCLVVEDAPAGVRAAKAGGMIALGVARLGDHDLLAAAGADRVVRSLDEVIVADLAAGRLERRAA